MIGTSTMHGSDSVGVLQASAGGARSIHRSAFWVLWPSQESSGITTRGQIGGQEVCQLPSSLDNRSILISSPSHHKHLLFPLLSGYFFFSQAVSGQKGQMFGSQPTITYS